MSSPSSKGMPPPLPSDVYSEDLMLRDHIHPKEFEALRSSGFHKMRPRMKRALALAQLQEEMLILDVGCGRGEFLLACARSGARAVGVDYAAGSLHIAQRILAALEPKYRPRIRLLRADCKGLPFLPGSFDRVFLLDVVEHLHPWELERCLAEVQRVLKSDGLVVIHTLPNRWALSVGYPVFRRIFTVLPRNPRREIEEKVHINEQSIVDLHRLLRRSDFDPDIWIEATILEQARWQKDRPAFGDARDVLYPLLRWPLIAFLFRTLMMTPLKLILGNDIYAIALKRGRPRNLSFGHSLPRRNIERFSIRIAEWAAALFSK